MARSYRYRCTRCGKQPGDTPDQARRNLFTKRIEFRHYGLRGSVIRSRTVAWLCRECMSADADYNRPENEVSDGMVQ